MEVTADIQLRGTAWNDVIKGLAGLFPPRPYYSLFMLALAIGIMYDKRVETPQSNGEDIKTVPRNVIVNNDGGRLDFYFQAAILSTATETLSEEERLELAFGEKGDFNKMSFLVSFANFGAEKLVSLIGDTDFESMDKLRGFLFSSVEGTNIEIEDVNLDDISLEEE